LLALDQANKTDNYTVLRDLDAPGFQAMNSAARLGEIFARERNDNLDLSGALVLDPQLTVSPRIENGVMRMAGFFPVRAGAGQFRSPRARRRQMAAVRPRRECRLLGARSAAAHAGSGGEVEAPGERAGEPAVPNAPPKPAEAPKRHWP
jgi:hypothetical protein